MSLRRHSRGTVRKNSEMTKDKKKVKSLRTTTFFPHKQGVSTLQMDKWPFSSQAILTRDNYVFIQQTTKDVERLWDSRDSI